MSDDERSEATRDEQADSEFPERDVDDRGAKRSDAFRTSPPNLIDTLPSPSIAPSSPLRAPPSPFINTTVPAVAAAAAAASSPSPVVVSPYRPGWNHDPSPIAPVIFASTAAAVADKSESERLEELRQRDERERVAREKVTLAQIARARSDLRAQMEAQAAAMEAKIWSQHKAQENERSERINREHDAIFKASKHQ